MSGSVDHDAPHLCPRCGSHVRPLSELASVAEEGRRAYESMRLSIPRAVSEALRTLGPQLRCHAGQCTPRQERLPLGGR
jgi:hypothetical protein